MRVLVVGGTGYLGQELLGELKRRGHSCQAASSHAASGLVMNLASEENCLRVLSKESFDRVVNLAAAGLGAQPATLETMTQTNGNGPSNLAAALLHCSPSTKLIHVGSVSEQPYGHRWESDYCHTKYQGYVKLRSNFKDSSNRTLFVCRIANVYGPNQPGNRFISHTISNLMNQGETVVHFPKRSRDFIFLDDAITQLSDLVEQPEDYRVIGTQLGSPLLQVAYLIAELLGIQNPRIKQSSQSPDPFAANPTQPLPWHYLPGARLLEDGLRLTIEERL